LKLEHDIIPTAMTWELNVNETEDLYFLPARPELDKVCSTACRGLLDKYLDSIWNN
jgi:hypothetical protein